MLLSMTGYGAAKGTFRNKTYSIDIRSLNGKTTDLRLRVPAYFKSKEVLLRKFVMDRLNRGKLDFSLNVVAQEGDLDYGLNLNLVESYYEQLSAVSNKFGLENQDFLQTIIRIPNVVEPLDVSISDEEWAYILEISQKAIDEIVGFRQDEGRSLQDDLQSRVDTIARLLHDVTPYEDQRKADLLTRLHKLMDDHLSKDNLDENRLEQEAVYYMEKLDVHEEKVRLEQHCKYFLEEMNSSDTNLGKKLGFIAQEMGREINTLGSKAQYSPIQKIVVKMKVELDQIKEQLANVV